MALTWRKHTLHNIAQLFKNTLTLRSVEEGSNLCYIVEVEFPSSIRVLYKGENYNQAAFAAEKAYSWLMQNSDPFDMLIEEPQGQGISYLSSTVDAFPDLTTDSKDFYQDLCDDFEAMKLTYIHDLNLLFRRIVNQFKLNHYQEQKFLKELKQRGHV